MPSILQAPHPRLYAIVFDTSYPRPLGDLPTPAWLRERMHPDGDSSLHCDDQVRGEIRDLLRVGGHKPTGRGKPASEYLQRAEALPAINLAVDACNLVSFHSGLPVSVVDLERGSAPWSLAIVEDDRAYVFNRAGQEIRLKGLLCLHDGEGPCANAVKDSMRTKTHDGTTRTLTVLWGAQSLSRATEEAFAEFRDVLERCSAQVSRWELSTRSS